MFFRMPVCHVIRKELGLVITLGEGRLTFEEARNELEQLLSNPDFSPAFNQLLDSTAVTCFDITVEEAKTLAGGRMLSPTSKLAFVAVKPDIFGMARLMEVYHEEHFQGTTRVFQSRDEALKWLGVPADAKLTADG